MTLLSRACLQQLSEACPLLLTLYLKHVFLEVGALLGLLPLPKARAQTKGSSFELHLLDCECTGDAQVVSLVADLALFCTQVQGEMLLILDPTQREQLDALMQHYPSCVWLGGY
eukprot:CAMPEP_0202893940 /NCGR_PEP_ID=MMETSP1392-20130828/3422_1 /ASSEMBLY_ACC=CAM_ASM_000868 /TAXON_ID=225041 /ORGANISM="Chlamydomonas chlamydogama, Strain SAG 11-48b" /LENGTH=113 /DNA_ID=CAMNT_0049578447 /DNA_START=11 /DNA_END=352 /DNA_ORIENTATION=+